MHIGVSGSVWGCFLRRRCAGVLTWNVACLVLASVLAVLGLRAQVRDNVVLPSKIGRAVRILAAQCRAQTEAQKCDAPKCAAANPERE